MIPCPSCGCHVRSSEVTCPSCGARGAGTSFRSATAAAVLMGLVACSGSTTDKSAGHSGETTPQPEYGVTVTDVMTDMTDMTAPHESGGSGGHSGN